jgi:hypothetical protein
MNAPLSFFICQLPFVICHLVRGNGRGNVFSSMTNDKWKMENDK